MKRGEENDEPLPLQLSAMRPSVAQADREAACPLPELQTAALGHDGAENHEVKRCETCEAPLLKRDSEKPYLFEKRRFCGHACANTKGTLAERFSSFVNKTDRCWLWTGKVDEAGYGLIKVGGRDGKWMRAHRIAFLLAHGYIPTNVLHHCDVPGCVREDHLFGGTIADNVADMIAKGRAAWQKGSRCVN